VTPSTGWHDELLPSGPGPTIGRTRRRGAPDEGAACT